MNHSWKEVIKFSLISWTFTQNFKITSDYYSVFTIITEGMVKKILKFDLCLRWGGGGVTLPRVIFILLKNPG